MEIIFTNPHFHFRKWLIRNIMRTFLFLFCTTLFALTPNNAFPQSTKIEIKENKKTSIDEVFDLIMDQTDYKFFYEEGIFKDLPKVELKKGVINVNELLKQSLLKANFDIIIGKNNTVIIKEKPKNVSSVQQKIKVTGKVTDQAGLPLPGANVLEKGTTNGTQTDLDGKFTISVENNAVLEFSFIGFKAKSLAVNGQSIINIVLQDSASSLDEVVVIGYGKQSKTKVLGSSTQIKAADLNKVASSNFAQQLSGKISGVQVSETSGQPGSDSKIVIRGIGTLTAGANPLIVVDGVPLSEGTTLNSISSNDIESVNVLKDAASAAIYGSRAANGVILVTTKKGKEGALKISFDYYTGIQRQASNVELVNTQEAAQYFNEARDWGYVSKNPTVRSENDNQATRIANGANLRQLRLSYLTNPGLSGLADTNWMDEIFRDAPISNYSLALSGGNEKSNYYVSGNYFNQDGVVIETGYKRYSSSIRLNTELSNKIKFGISFNPSFSVQNKYNQDDGWNTNPVASIYVAYPFFSAYNSDGSLAIGNQIAANTPQDGALTENPVAMMKMNSNVDKNFRLFGSTFLTYDIIDGLQFKSMLGGDYRSGINEFYSPKAVGYYRTPAPKAAVATETSSIIKNIIAENTLEYNKTFGNHQIELLTGYTYQKEDGTSSAITGSGIPDDNIQNIAGASAYSVNSSKYVWTMVSYLGRAQYFYKERYQLTGTLRRDGSSRFGDNSKWGLFPSIAAGWVFSKESFFPVTDVFTLAKIRASWGQTGNNQIGSYGSISLMNTQNYVYGNNLAAGFSNSTSPNPDLSWETRTSTNIGLDIGLYEKFTITTDVYSSINSNLLLNVPVPQQSGFTTSTQNVGEVKNSGIEIAFGGNDINLGQVKWSFGSNIYTNKNKILKLANGQDQIITGYQGSFRTKVGGPIAELYGYNILGVYKTNAEIAETPHMPGTLTGDYIMEDINKDGIIDTKDKKGFGSYSPKLSYGFNSSFTYKGFEFNFSINGIEGRKKLDRELAVFLETGEGFSMPDKYYFDNRYHPVNNPNGFLAQPNMGNFSSNRQAARGSSNTFTNADYIRLRDIQLAYNVPQSYLEKIGLTKARVYLSGNNLINITKHRGFNSEATTDNVLEMGYNDQRTYPTTKSIIFGTNITF